MQIKILHEDKEIFVIHKPAGFPVQTARLGQADCVSELKNYMYGKRTDAAKAKKGRNKGKEPYLGIVHRLDQPVEGVLVFAKTKEAAAALSAQAADGRMKKRYYALVYDGTGELAREETSSWKELTDYVVKDGRTNTARIARQGAPEAKEARLEYRSLGMACREEGEGRVFGVEIRLLTGRFHQIRVQMAHHGMPLMGDNKYGSGASPALSARCGVQNVALCAYCLEFFHPSSGGREVWECSPQGLELLKPEGEG